MNYKTILVLLEFEDGSVRQVLTTKEQKELALQMMVSESGKVMVSDEIEPITLKFLPPTDNR